MRARKKAARPGAALVYVEDRGAVYDAPIEVVWDFWRNDDTFHPKAHKATVRNFRDRKLSDVTTLVTYEKRRGRRWEKRSCRMTVVPPAVRVQEDLIGPDAGSIKLFVYSPKGRRTVVDVLAYLRSTDRTAKQVEHDARRMFANAYREDLPWFRKYVQSRKTP